MRGNRKLQRVAILCLLLLCGLELQAGEESAAPEPSSMNSAPDYGRPLRADVQLVLVNVSVIDNYDRFVTGLQKEHFKVFEDKTPQQIEVFSQEDAPISAGIIFDASGSMSNKMEKARLAVKQFFRGSNPDDEFFLIGFSDRPNVLSGFTRELGSLQDKLNFTPAKGRTALLDAVYLGLHEMQKARHPRKVLLVFSDGGDNHSRYSPRDLKEAVKEADVQIYGIGIFEPEGYRGRTIEEMTGPSLLSEIAEMSGGRAMTVENLDDLPAVARKVGREVRQLYVLGYAPTNKRNDGKWRKIQVKLNSLKGMLPLHLFSKNGYYAPQE